MRADVDSGWGAEAASAIGWWRDAGVDVLVQDAPRNWLQAASPAPGQTSPALASSPPRPATAASSRAEAPVTTPLPATIADFVAWRTGPDAPEAAWHAPMLPASGPWDADLMVLLDCPEREDREALLKGAAGRLFDRMLAAIGRSRADVHIASVCAARPAAGRMPPELEVRLAEIARHHAALVAPARLLALGNAASRAILSTDVANARSSLQELNHKVRKVSLVAASFHPRFLIERPAMKAEAWRDLQMLMGARA